MYAHENFKTKKALKDAVKAGVEVRIFAPGLGTPKTNGREFLEGPHYPAPHSWYASVQMKDGLVVGGQVTHNRKVNMTHEEVLQDMLDACEGGDHLEIYVEVTGRAGLAIIDEDGDEVEAYFHHDLTREQREAVIALYVPPADDARYGCGSAMDWPPQ